MKGPEQSPPPRTFGDPSGPHWSAEVPAGPDGEEHDLAVEGDVIRFAWEYGVLMPLWDGNGLLPEEPEWSRRALGLSDALITGLADWGRAMDRLDADGLLGTGAQADLERRAEELLARLRQELHPRFTVEYTPW